MANVTQSDIQNNHPEIVNGTITGPGDIAKALLPQEFLQAVNGTAIGDIANTIGYAISRVPASIATQVGVNGLNNIRRSDPDAIPLQFVYEAANCRLFTTPAIVNNVTGM